MEDKFYLNIQYKNTKQKVQVTDPNCGLDVLIQNLKHLQDREGKYMFDMPTMDVEGTPNDYVFGKIEENGQVSLLHPKRGKTEFCLRDYNVQSGDTLELVPDPKAGGN